MGGGGEKTEKATSKRRQDERKKGNVFTSKEINTLVGLLAVVFTLQFLGNWILSVLTGGIDRFWTMGSNTVLSFSSDTMRGVFVQAILMYAATALIPLLVAGLVGVVTTFAQTKGLISGDKLKPKFSNMSPLKGIKKIFSLRGLMELGKSIVKIVILGYVIYNQYSERFNDLPRLFEMEFPQVVYYAANFVMDIVTSAAIIFAFLAALDYLYQRWQYEKDLRMTKQEVKEEYKQLEGDPRIKGQRRRKQQEMAQSRMMQNVPEADVIIRNPTHYAVAISYEAGKNRAPVVLAKGMDLIALRIVKLAEENKVTVVENRPLARGLYENIPLDREISEEFFQPVAEILAIVYETTKKHKLPKVVQHGRDGRGPNGGPPG
ncbi:flagellar biosynthesis protein FlhB [Ruminococcaceae bacterium OttesenSCG-928-D13]|nr:flagellar biosynthesis protein FlhB [Ruminococcaceae bacterium OttesenSCG-928-D13]